MTDALPRTACPLSGLNGINIIGANVVDVAPAYNHADITTMAAATLVFDLPGLMVNRSNAASIIGDQALEGAIV
jgi:agmatinase